MRVAHPEIRLEILTRAACLGLAACIGSTTASAQDTTNPPDSTASRPSYWLAGMSVGIPTAQGEFEAELTTLGFQFTRARPGRLGPDFSVGTMPRVLAEGLMVLGVRAGVALPLQVAPGVMLLPSGGLSLIGAASGTGAGGFAGFNLGGSAVIQSNGPLGIRAGMTWHRFQDATMGIWLLELGVVRSPRKST